MTTTRVRARDSDRTATCEMLDRAFAEGQIDGTEHRERTAAALQARSLEDLRSLVGDLQGTQPPPPTRPPSGPARAGRSRAAVVVVLVVVLGTLALVVSGFVSRYEQRAARGTSTTTASGSEGGGRVVRPADLHTDQGWRRLVDDLRTARGTAVVYRVVVYPTYAVLTVPVPGEPGRALTVSYRGGVGSTGSPTTHDPDEPPVDLAAVDPRPMLALLAGVDRSVAVRDATTRYLTVDDDGRGEGPTVSIHASNEYQESGYLVARPDGTVLSVHPHEP